MFKSIPSGADAYIMKRIVHDWSDEQSGKIMSFCRAGVTNDGKLLATSEANQPAAERMNFEKTAGK
jgi:hypothetical protein